MANPSIERLLAGRGAQIGVLAAVLALAGTLLAVSFQEYFRDAPNSFWLFSLGVCAVVCAVALVGLVIVLRAIFTSRIISSDDADAESAISISVGNEPPLSAIKIKKHNWYVVTRTVYLEIKNTSHEKSITNCKVTVVDIEPWTGRHGPWVLEENFSMAAGDSKRVALATHGEPIKANSGVAPDTIIELAYGQPDARPLLPLTESILTVRVTGFDCAARERKFKLWADDAGIMRVAEQASAPVIERDVSLRDAIHYLACGTWQGNWEAVTFDKGAEKFLSLPTWVDEVRQKALDGALPIWGTHYQYDTVVYPIPKEYWIHGRFDERSLVEIDPDEFMAKSSLQDSSYYHLKTSAAKVKELWPR